jgi:N-acetylmuramoyl-L-alanine amidase
MPFLMKYDIIPRYLPGPSQRRPLQPLQPCRFMVAHDTGNPGSTAANNVAYYTRTAYDMSASAHIFVDDRQIIECIPFLTGTPEKAYHVGYNVITDNNRYGVDSNDAAGGVELCYGGSINLNESYARYVWVMAYSCYTYGLDPLRDIVGHNTLDPARRTDPTEPLRQLGKTFDDFLRDVYNELQASTIVEPDPELWLTAEDANKLILYLSAGWNATEDPAARAEFNRLANELRRVSGQEPQ